MEKEIGVVIDGLKSALWGSVHKCGLPGPLVVLVLEGMIYNIELGEARKKLAAVKVELSTPRDGDGDHRKADGESS